MKKWIASLLIYCNFFQVALAAFPNKYSNDSNPQFSQASGFKAYNQAPIPEALSLSTEQFGLAGPISAGMNYSDLTGAFVSGQYLKAISDILGVGLIAEYGAGQ